MQKNTQKQTEKKMNNIKIQKLLYEEDSYLIRGVCFDLYKELGNGHKEVVYQRAMDIKLKDAKFKVEREKKIPVKIDGHLVGNYTPDIIINDKILLELKAKPAITVQDKKQFWHYLKTTDYKLGFLINFGRSGGVEIIRRVYDKARKQILRDSA